MKKTTPTTAFDVTSHGIACQVLGKDPKKVTSVHEMQNDIAKAINKIDGFVPSFKKPEQEKWRPYFYVNASGFRFHCSKRVRSDSHPDVGSRLCMYFRTDEISEFYATQHLELHKNVFYGKKPIAMKYTDITSHEAACAVLFKDPAQSITTDQKITDICKAINKISGFTPDFNNEDQKKWRAYNIVDASGFRFGSSNYDDSYSYSTPYVGSRLCHYFSTKEEADHFGKTFVDLNRSHYYEQ